MEAVNDGMANISLESASTATSVEDSVESLAKDLDMLNIQSPAASRPKAPIADVVIPAYPRSQHRLREELYKVVEKLPRPKSCPASTAAATTTTEWSKKEDNLLMHLVWRAGGIGSENLWSRVYDEFNPFPGGVTPR